MQFFGTHDFGWLMEQEVKPFDKFREALIGGSKVVSFRKAIKEVDEFIVGKNIINTITEPVAPNLEMVESSTSKCAPPENDTKQNEIDGVGEEIK